MAQTRAEQAQNFSGQSSESTPRAEDGIDERCSSPESVGMLEKDETEERLEKLVFGDEAEFLNSLQRPEHVKQVLHLPRSDESSQKLQGNESLEDVADDDLFFLDSGPNILTKDPRLETAGYFEDEDVLEDCGRESTWIDSDDDRTTISLASNNRLRKLRNTEAEDVITGREYVKRLRRQYERLHPPPEWASQTVKVMTDNKKRRRSSLDDTSSDYSGLEMSLDEEASLPPVQPLAELLRNAGSLTHPDGPVGQPTKRRRLRPEVLDIQLTKPVTGHGPSSIDCLQFHPYHPLLLSAGPASTICLHHISPNPPNPNPLLTSLHVKKTPLHSVAFRPPQTQLASPLSSDDTTIYLSSRRRYFHTWALSTGTITKITRPLMASKSPHYSSAQRTMESFHLSPCGRYIGFIGSARKGGGSINILSTTTHQLFCSCRIDSMGGVADFAWWRDGNGISVAGKNGEVSEFDICDRRVVGRWMEEGAVGTTVIALGGEMGRKGLGGDRYIAVGSSSGIVNIYDRTSWSSPSKGSSEPSIPRKPKPLRSLMNLTTPISHLVFASDGQMLVMASRWKKDALRLVHLPSCTTYANWPTDRTPLGRISSVALSPDGGYLAVANEQGKIRLWEIRG